ncbi:transposase [Sagittula marina]|uniref:Transposase n=1 Tax=Sagittula marina TaxID=943940 RepID=A0A7W6DPT7_9RHOB|nr:transposase [Sagittula marina]
MSDEGWAFFERFILAVRAPNGRKPTNHRLVLDGVFWIARTGAPWRDLPEEFGKWSSVYRQFRRWMLAGLWEDIMDTLNQSGVAQDALQMIPSHCLQANNCRAVDSTVIRAHHPLPGRALREQCPEREAAGAKGGLCGRVLAVLDGQAGKRSTGSFSDPPSTSRPRSTSASMARH